MSNERQKMGQSTDEIEGRLSTAEYEMLYELAKTVPSNQAIVEIPCGQGEVAKCLARGAQAGQGNKVNKIILHPATEPGTTSDSIHTRETIKHDSGTTGSQDTIINLPASADDAAKRWREQIGLLVISDVNEYEDVKRVFLCWQRHLSQDARVTIFNCSKPGPARAVREQLGDCGNFTSIRSVGATVVLALDRCQHHWIINSDEIGICKYCKRKRNFKRLAREIASLEIGQRIKGQMSKSRENHGERRKK
ncbi:MAG: hypothetical protein MUO24_00950 [Desulfobacterales bacterium]|nr:hypothetical protein [Desulfobacterales bacterium]